jgi:nicotinate-nucleotide pyrophosphorylase (carboxylating)
VSCELPRDLAAQVSAALREDVGWGDVTAALIPADHGARAHVVAREAGVLCGRAWADETYRQIDSRVRTTWQAHDAATVQDGGIIVTIEGPARSILTGERTALNFLQTLSGTATATRRFVDAMAGTRCRLLDTRKTLPGLRTAQKYAVCCAGGQNHRMGLYDMVLIKENHIAAAGSIGSAVAAARRASPRLKVEVEVESLSELDQALEAAPDIVMLDDFAIDTLREAVQRNAKHARPVKLEASGGISLENVRAIAETGVDYVSVGSITKNVRALDLSMRID